MMRIHEARLRQQSSIKPVVPMPVVKILQKHRRRISLQFWCAMLGLIFPVVSKADNTNAVLPVVSVQAAGNTTESSLLPGTFTVQRTGDTSRALEVNYRVSGSATNGVDYQPLSGIVTIPAGQSTAQILVTPINRQQEGNDLNVTITLTATNTPFTIVALPDTQYYTREILWRHA